MCLSEDQYSPIIGDKLRSSPKEKINKIEIIKLFIVKIQSKMIAKISG